jgi:hypothetical protein
LSYELLVGGFAKYPITALFVSPIQAVFEEDPCPYNFRLVSRSGADSNDGRRFPKFYAAIALNPTLRNWRDQLSREVLRGKAVAIKLHPNYHSYHLTDGAARELLTACGEVGLPVIVQMRMQDTRSHHPLMQVPDVDIAEVLEAAAATPQTQFVIGGIKWGEASGKANDINALPNVWLDISQCEVVDVLRRLIRLFGAKKLLFGTHAPFFYVKSAQLKLEEAQLTEEEKELITEKNAKELFGLSV